MILWSTTLCRLRTRWLGTTTGWTGYDWVRLGTTADLAEQYSLKLGTNSSTRLYLTTLSSERDPCAKGRACETVTDCVGVSLVRCADVPSTNVRVDDDTPILKRRSLIWKRSGLPVGYNTVRRPEATVTGVTNAGAAGSHFSFFVRNGKRLRGSSRFASA